MHKSQLTSWSPAIAMLLAACLAFNAGVGAQTSKSDAVNSKDKDVAAPSSNDEVKTLRDQLALQQKQIDQLQKALEEQKQLLLHVIQVKQGGPSIEAQSVTQQASAGSEPSQNPNLGQVASLKPVIPAAKVTTATDFTPRPEPGSPPVTQDQMQSYVKKVDTMEKTVETLSRGVAGFKFSGDFRYRFDAIARAGNSVAGPQQNVRERYRLRFNVDKAISSQFDAHFQLGSGTFNNPLTFDTDFAGANNRGPIFITEFWGAYHPNRYVDLRAGKMPDVFAHGSRFFFDDDLRLNGFQQTGKVPLARNGVGVKSIEFRAGQYILTNPNVTVLPSASQCTSTPQTITGTSVPTTITLPSPTAALPANCAYLAAGFPPGGKARDTNLFDQGIAFFGDVKEGWSHQFITDIQLWRNPNALQLASSANGFPVLVSPYYGVTVTSGPPETGTATTTKGGAIFTAANFQVGRIDYRITHVGWKTSRQSVPVWLELQASRNFGAGFARNAWMGTLSAGEVKKFGDVRFQYIYAYKDANSMVAQVTDDDLGTTTGVNIRTHLIRVDLGLNKFLEWDNKFWIQDPVRGNDPVRNLFVTVPAGANTSYRVQSEFNVKF